MKVLHALLITAISCGLANSSALAGAGRESRNAIYYNSRPDTRLVIKRAANFGNYSSVSLYIDGRLAKVLNYGGSFDGIVPAGRHLITMKQTPHLNDAYPYSQHWVHLAPGQTSVFTAIWRNGGTFIALEGS